MPPEPQTKIPRRPSAAPNGRLHLAFVLPSLNGGGAERVTLTLAKSLLERGHRVDLILARLRGDYRADIPPGMPIYYARLWNPDQELRRHCQRLGLPLNPLTINPAASAAAWLSLRRRHPRLRIGPKPSVLSWIIARYLRQARPQLLMSAPDYANLPALYAAELTANAIPVIVAEHNNISMSYTGTRLPEARQLYPQAAAVVAVSQGVGHDIARLLDVPPHRIHTIYNPIPSARIRQMAQEDTTHPWFAPNNPPVILSVGRESPQKDYPTLVAAFGMLRRRIPARLVIMGRLSPTYRAALITQAQNCGAAQDLGFIDFDQNPYRYMRAAGLLALSSRWEGLPTVLLEAMACGAPVVSADTPHGPREILADGQWGKLTPIGDAPALAQAMLETLQGDRPPAAALQRRAAEFSEERAADAYLHLFQKVTHTV